MQTVRPSLLRRAQLSLERLKRREVLDGSQGTLPPPGQPPGQLPPPDPAEQATEAEIQFAEALAHFAFRLGQEVVTEDMLGLPANWVNPDEGADYGGGTGSDPNNPLLADKPKPLTTTELDRLIELVKVRTPSPQQKAERSELTTRLQGGGVKFDGASTLEKLDKVLDVGKGLPAAPRKIFLQAYQEGLKVAVGGLQKIDEERYKAYKRAREGGASHDEGWTWQYGGETAQRRYTLEKLIEKAK